MTVTDPWSSANHIVLQKNRTTCSSLITARFVVVCDHLSLIKVQRLGSLLYYKKLFITFIQKLLLFVLSMTTRWVAEAASLDDAKEVYKLIQVQPSSPNTAAFGTSEQMTGMGVA